MLSRFHRIPERDGRTDRQTDGRQYRASTISVGYIIKEIKEKHRLGLHHYSITFSKKTHVI